MVGLIPQLFSPDGFMPRTACGPDWTPALILSSQIADVVIFMSYMLIPFALIGMYKRVRSGGEIRSQRIGAILSASFIFTCGLTHLMDRLMFSWPAYRLTACVLVVCASCSIATVSWMLYTLGGFDGRK